LSRGIGLPVALIQASASLLEKQLFDRQPVKKSGLVTYPLFGEGGIMYLLFSPAIAAVVVIGVIQLRDHFVAAAK
jgi:hypothetical protein